MTPLPLPLPLVRASLALALVVGTLAVVGTLGVTVPLQPVLGAAFVLWVPGAAAVTLIPLDDRLVAVVLAIATSVAITTLAAMAMLWARIWEPTLMIVALSAVSAVVLDRARVRASAAVGRVR